MGNHESNTRSKSSVGWRVTFVIALIVFVVSVGALVAIGFSYFQGQMKYDEVAQNADFDPSELESEDKLKEAHVDWDALKAANPDTVAWLYIPNTNINYPVVQAADNDYYLTHDFDGEAGWLANYGAVFMDCRNKADWSDQLYFFYGHHMNDGSMFADLAGLTGQERFDQCRTVYLLTPTGNFRLRTFTLAHVNADETIVQSNFSTPDEMAAYLQDKINQSVVDPGVIPPVNEITKAFAFATCDNLYEDGRYILYAYVEQASAEGLIGDLGLAQEGDQTVGFANGLSTEGSES